MARQGDSKGGTFSSLRVRNFRLFIFGQTVSGIGTQIGMVAAPWLVLLLTHSGVALGVDVALGSLPILLFGAWGGLIADRFDNRRAQIWTQVAYCLLTVPMWLLVATGVVEVWMVFLQSFLLGIVSAIDMPVRQSFYLEMVGPENLTNAMSLNTATFPGTRIIGAAVGAALIGLWGVGPAFLIDGLSYLAVVIALAAMRTRELHARPRQPRGKGQVREGFRYVWSTPDLKLPILLMLVVFLFSYNFMVLIPLLATRSFSGGAGTYGAMLALFGVGAFAGALVMAGHSGRPNPQRLAVLAAGVGVASIALALSPVVAVAWLLLPLVGALYISFPITGNSTLQLTASGQMRGRVMSIYTVVFLGSTPIGGPLAGWVGEHMGPRIGLAAGGAIAIVAAAVALAALRRTASAAPT